MWKAKACVLVEEEVEVREHTHGGTPLPPYLIVLLATDHCSK